MPFSVHQHQQKYFPTVQPTAQAYVPPGQNVYPQQDFSAKMTIVKEMKLPIKCFNGKEEYKRLGAGFKDWVLEFPDEFGAASASVEVNGLKNKR